jgi:hypothetical protein
LISPSSTIVDGSSGQGGKRSSSPYFARGSNGGRNDGDDDDKEEEVGGTGGKSRDETRDRTAATGGSKDGSSSPYFARDSNGDEGGTNNDKKMNDKVGRANGGRRGGRRRLLLASASSSSGEDEDGAVDGTDNDGATATGNAVVVNVAASRSRTTRKPRERAPFIRRGRVEVANDNRGDDDDDDDADVDPTNVGGDGGDGGIEPDGHGGLNQPSDPWTVELSKTGRATCRTCDQRIGKGELRVGHAPLFRGKPGFVVYRHLDCAVFPEDIARTEDVVGHAELNDDDISRLSDRIEISKALILEENTELRPDELVQDSFRMADVCMRAEPRGLNATLLPFQLEGYNWMRHQETSASEGEKGGIRGGILADEMVSSQNVQGRKDLFYVLPRFAMLVRRILVK